MEQQHVAVLLDGRHLHCWPCLRTVRSNALRPFEVPFECGMCRLGASDEDITRCITVYKGFDH